MLKINSASLQPAISRQMYQTQKDTERAYKELASGSRFSDASVNPAGQAISERLRGQIKGFEAARANADNASSFIQVAEGSLAEQNNLLIRMRELAVQAASDTYSSEEREFLDYEYQSLNAEVDRIAGITSYGSMKLLSGEKQQLEFQVGAGASQYDRVQVNLDLNTNIDSLDTAGTDVGTTSDARNSLESLDGALMKVGDARARLGAIQSRLDHAVDHTLAQSEALESAHSKIADADIASSISRARKGEILLQYQAAALRGAMDQSATALRLIA